MANITVPDALVPYFREYTEDQKAKMIAALGPTPPQEQVDQISAISLNQFAVGIIKKILLQWYTEKKAAELGSQVEPLENASQTAIDDYKGDIDRIAENEQ
jgi:hypothetical protein